MQKGVGNLSVYVVCGTIVMSSRFISTIKSCMRFILHFVLATRWTSTNWELHRAYVPRLEDMTPNGCWATNVKMPSWDAYAIFLWSKGWYYLEFTSQLSSGVVLQTWTSFTGGTFSETVSSICDISRAVDHMLRFPRHSPSVLHTVNDQGVEGLGMGPKGETITYLFPANVSYKTSGQVEKADTVGRGRGHGHESKFIFQPFAV